MKVLLWFFCGLSMAEDTCDGDTCAEDGLSLLQLKRLELEEEEGRPRPQHKIDACNGKEAGASCTFTDFAKERSGVCTERNKGFMCQSPLACEGWCSRHTNPWTTKCTWENCNDCDACGSEPTLPPTTAPTPTPTTTLAPEPTLPPTTTPTTPTTPEEHNPELSDPEPAGGDDVILTPASGDTEQVVTGSETDD